MKRAIALSALISLLPWLPMLGSPSRASEKASPFSGPSLRLSEGPVTSAAIVAGPFDLHRKYRSMEGPYVTKEFRVSDLIASKRVAIPESMIQFVEKGADGPSMMAGDEKDTDDGTYLAAVNTADRKRELYWFKGISLEVLDENDKVLPTAEFICHLNLDVNQSFRQRAFRQAKLIGNTRLITLTQGQTNFFFPEGFAVPVASDEKWTFTFQAANRTTLEHRRLKHRCLLTFIKDSELTRPVKALTWYNPYICVVVDKRATQGETKPHGKGPNCLMMSDGANAPNAVQESDFSDGLGQRLSGHWEVPAGTHSYRTPISEERDPGFAAKKRRIHAVWTHLHPLCTSTSLLECTGQSERPIFTVKSSTTTVPGLEIEHIDSIISGKGVALPAKHHYELEATYENTTGEPQDSMVAFGVFFQDDNFARPRWVLTGEKDDVASCDGTAGKSGKGLFCGINSFYQRVAESAGWAYPLFNPKTDGPLLTEPKTIELLTSAGKIRLQLDPQLAPQHATQMYKLFTHGIFDGTPFFRCEPDYLIQTAVAETKVAGQHQLAKQQLRLLRRLPLEVSAQTNGRASHKRLALSMARWDDPNSAVSSFSILLHSASHLDNEFTIFGHVQDDPVTVETLDRMTREWPGKKPVILSASEEPSVASR